MSAPLTFQETVLRLKQYWSERGCIIQEPYDVEVGAGTMAPETFLRVLGPRPYNVAYVQPSRRPADRAELELPGSEGSYLACNLAGHVQTLLLDALGSRFGSGRSPGRD